MSHTHVDATACRALWCEVIATALADAQSPAGSPDAQARKRQVDAWVQARPGHAHGRGAGGARRAFYPRPQSCRFDRCIRSASSAASIAIGSTMRSISDAIAASTRDPPKLRQGVTPRSRQQLIQALISGIIADADDARREVVLTIHWQGGQHSQLRVCKPRTGGHGCQTPKQALVVMERMATL